MWMTQLWVKAGEGEDWKSERLLNARLDYAGSLHFEESVWVED